MRNFSKLLNDGFLIFPPRFILLCTNNAMYNYFAMFGFNYVNPIRRLFSKSRRTVSFQIIVFLLLIDVSC